MDFDPLRRGFAEFVGAFTLIFAGAGSTLAFTKLFLSLHLQGGPSADLASGLALLGVAFANGLAIAVMVSAVGHISGGHFNPAITLGFLLTRRLAGVLSVVYWLGPVAPLTAPPPPSAPPPRPSPRGASPPRRRDRSRSGRLKPASSSRVPARPHLLSQ